MFPVFDNAGSYIVNLKKRVFQGFNWYVPDHPICTQPIYFHLPVHLKGFITRHQLIADEKLSKRTIIRNG